MAKASETQKKRILALLFVAIASYALLTTATGRIIESLEPVSKELGSSQGTSDQPTQNRADDEVTVQELLEDDSGLRTVVILGNEPKPIMNEVNDRLIIFRLFVWSLTISLVPLFILPIEVIESAGIRLRLDQRMVVVSPTSPFKLLLGGFTIIGVAAAVLYEITSGMLLQYSYILFLTFLPLIPMILLYLTRSEKSASVEFREYICQKKMGSERSSKISSKKH